MPLSPTDFQTDVVCRYFIESCKIFTINATFTDGFPDRHSPSVFYRELLNIYSICHKHRWKNSVGIFSAGTFFCAHFLYVNLSVFEFFFTDRISDKMLNYRWMLCRRTVSVGELVGKNFTDELVILHQWNIFVGKTIKCCSDLLFWNKFLWHDSTVAFFGFGDGVAGVFGLVGVLKHNRSS